MALVDLSIIIISWNVSDLLATCLESIQRGPTTLQIETIVVDSASSDNSVEMTRTRFPWVKLMPQTENLGFTRCNNIGFKVAQGRHHLLLNPDTEVIGDALDKMVAYLDTHPDVGIVGPHTLNTDGTTQSTKRRFPTLAVGIFESTWLQKFASKGVLPSFYTEDIPDKATADVDWVQGSALMARREVYEQIGGLDEGYVMYSEELDWCKRARDAGWRVVYVGDAQIIHHGGKSTEQAAARKYIYYHQSRLRYFRKHHGWLTAQFLRIVVLLNYIWQIILEGVKGILGHKRSLRWQRVQNHWQVLRSGLRVT